MTCFLWLMIHSIATIMISDLYTPDILGSFDSIISYEDPFKNITWWLFEKNYFWNDLCDYDTMSVLYESFMTFWLCLAQSFLKLFWAMSGEQWAFWFLVFVWHESCGLYYFLGKLIFPMLLYEAVSFFGYCSQLTATAHNHFCQT